MAPSASARSKQKETFSEYLRRVGADYAESGSEFTAQDYKDAAQRIEYLEAKVLTLLRQRKLKKH